MLPVLIVSYCTLQSLEDTLFTLVDTPEALGTMVQKLQGAAEVAVDLEHHSYRYIWQLMPGGRSLHAVSALSVVSIQCIQCNN